MTFKSLKTFAAIMCLCGFASAETIYYLESNDNITNPDRGFYHHTEVHTSAFESLDMANLVSRRVDGYLPGTANYRVNTSIVLRHYVLDSFVNQDDLSAVFLANVEHDFTVARDAGVRLIVRFSYTITPNTGACGSWICPPYGDAPKSRVLRHIEQLKPILSANEDVLFTVQNGFIGVWGEQYYTDYFGGPGTLTDQNWLDRSDVVSALLDATPSSRMIQVRYPQMKQKYGQPSATIYTPAMQESDAYNGSDLSRIGFHNDCFLTDAADQGTFNDYGSSSLPPIYGSEAIDALRQYHIADSPYVVVGGETCADVDYATNLPHENDCDDNVIALMDTYNYSFLNADYNNDVNNDWTDDNCMPDIMNQLGYRLVLRSAEFPDNTSAGQPYSFSLTIENVGFAAPVNERQLALVLQRVSDGAITRLPITGANSDSRTWYSGKSVTLTPSVMIPSEIVDGDYDLYLHIYDASNAGAIEQRPEYSIQLANQGLWQADSGYNRLNKRITLSDNATQKTTVSVTSDLNNVIFDIRSDFFGDGYDLFIDADNQSLTGFQHGSFTASGADYLIENGSLYRYTGDGTSWAWESSTQPVQSNSLNDQQLQLSIARTAFDVTPLASSLSLAFVNFNQWTPIDLFPEQGEFVRFSVAPPLNITVDGQATDWLDVPTLVTSVNGIDVLKAHQDSSGLYLLTQGQLNSHYQFYLNVDGNADTGFTQAQWVGGADYLIENGNLYRHQNTGWDWQQINDENVFLATKGASLAEVYIARELIGHPETIGVIYYDQINYDIVSTLPSTGGFATY